MRDDGLGKEGSLYGYNMHRLISLVQRVITFGQLRLRNERFVAYLLLLLAHTVQNLSL